VGQRVVAGGAHVGGVVVVSGAELVRDVLIPVYEALGLEWDSDTVGSVEAEVPGITWDQVEGAILTAFGARFDLEERRLDTETLAGASEASSSSRAQAQARLYSDGTLA
jgi:octanoyl-[GcvH]:protein N-octanoyltransferase